MANMASCAWPMGCTCIARCAASICSTMAATGRNGRHHCGKPVGYRWPGRPVQHREGLVVILLFWPDDGPLREWQLAPPRLADGAQARRNGPRTRALRA